MSTPTQTTPPDAYARVYGSPGAQPRLRGMLRLLLPILLTVASAGYLLRAALPQPPLSLPAVGVCLVVVALLFAAAVQGSTARLAAFLKGARGEEAIGRMLALLNQDYAVFHGLAGARDGRSPGDDWDHVVVGPTGVFVIETKNWDGPVQVEGGRVLVRGREPDRAPLAQVTRAANAVRALLRDACGETLPVQPVLCFTATGAPALAADVSGVIVCGERHVLGTIQQRAGGALTPELRRRAAAALESRASGV